MLYFTTTKLWRMLMKKVCIYARNSVLSGNPENQIHDLREVAKRNDWVITKVYKDIGVSGTKGRDKRPEFDSMLKSAMRKDFDLVMFWAVDRASRNLNHLVQMMSELDSKNVGMYFHQQAIDTTTPSGRAMIQMAGVFASFEASMIKQRVLASHERARQEGKTIGRPSTISEGLIKSVQYMRKNNIGIKRIAKELGCGVGTVYKVLDQQSV